MNERLLHSMFIIAYAGLIIVRLASHRAVAKTLRRADFKEGKLNMAMRIVAGVTYMGALLIYAFNPWFLQWGRFPLQDWVRWIGVVLAVGSILLLAWVQWALGKNFSTTLHVREGHTLATRGPYRLVRHPMYTVLTLYGIGLTLMTGNWVIGAPVAVSLPLLVATRLGKEEELMIEQFGDEYREYMKRTGRFLPRIRSDGRESPSDR